jgi:hypothetical protein
MRLCKRIAQNVAQLVFRKNVCFMELSRPNMWDTSVIFKQLPKLNNHPLGVFAESGRPAEDPKKFEFS